MARERRAVMPPMMAYTIAGTVLGALGALVIGRSAPMQDAGVIGTGQLLRLGVAGAILGVGGAVVDRSPRKLLAGGLAGALGLVMSFLVLARTFALEADSRAVVAMALGVAGAYGSLVALIYSLVEDDFHGVSYPLLLGAIGGLAGVGLTFALSLVTDPGRVNPMALCVFYGAMLWTAIALSRKLEREEALASPPGGGR